METYCPTGFSHRSRVHDLDCDFHGLTQVNQSRYNMAFKKKQIRP